MCSPADQWEAMSTLWGINIHVVLTTQSVISELSDSKHVHTSDFTEHGDAGDVCQHLLHACGWRPLPVHDDQQGGPGSGFNMGVDRQNMNLVVSGWFD